MLHTLVYQNDKISIVFQRWLILVDIVGGYPCKPYHTTPNHAIPYNTEKGNKKIRSNFQNHSNISSLKQDFPLSLKGFSPFECASRTWEILLTHITDQWAVVVGLFCSRSVFFGFGFGAYFSATHPPVSGAPSNVELRVVRQCDDEQLLLSRFGSLLFFGSSFVCLCMVGVCVSKDDWFSYERYPKII